MPELIEIAKEILSINPGCALSGSLALKANGLSIRREPKDIDIYLPWGVSFTKLESMTRFTGTGDNDDYPEDDYNRDSYKVDRIQVDVFSPVGADVPPLEFSPIDGLNVVNSLDIIKFKISHALFT